MGKKVHNKLLTKDKGFTADILVAARGIHDGNIFYFFRILIWIQHLKQRCI